MEFEFSKGDSVEVPGSGEKGDYDFKSIHIPSTLSSTVITWHSFPHKFRASATRS